MIDAKRWFRAGLLWTISCIFSTAFGQKAEEQDVIRSLFTYTLEEQNAYKWLGDLCQIGSRPSGSEGAKEAVLWAEELMKSYGFDSVYLQEVDVPYWVRGEEMALLNALPLAVTALGGSVSTPSEGIKRKVVEVRDFDELDQLGEAGIQGKIVFFNYPMKQHFIQTSHAYADAVKYRWRGAKQAAEYGAEAVLIRSLTNRTDDFPHTGSMSYADAPKRIPAAALSTISADRLSDALKKNPEQEVYLNLQSEDKGRVKSYNVIGEIRGTVYPDEILLVGGHLDSWDLAEGAHDDGAGCVHAMGAAEALRSQNIRLKRTLRVLLFMNEEFGLDGAKTYAEWVRESKQKHIVALESDAGGYIPRGFSFETDSASLAVIRSWQPLFLPYGLFEFGERGSGADVGQLRGISPVLGGLRPESQRYFDVHHAATDVYEAVHPRELEMGTASLAALLWLLDKYDVGSELRIGN